MLFELDVAGEFIYDGLQTLNHMESITNGAELFSFLYHVSVGIERLQKIIIVIQENIDPGDYDEFIKKLKTHKHIYLQQKIASKTGNNLTFSKRENKFLEILCRFYNKSRYNRFIISESYNHEKQLLVQFILDNAGTDHITCESMSGDIVLNNRLKDYLGRIVGRISYKYYNLIRTIADSNNLFTYELRSNSKAEKVFLPTYRNKSLIEMKKVEEIAFKELLLLISNTEERDSFLDYLKHIPPLDLDVAFVNEYLSEVIKGNIPQSLIDEVETIYDEMEMDWKERLHLIDAIGNIDVNFDNDEFDDDD